MINKGLCQLICFRMNRTWSSDSNLQANMTKFWWGWSDLNEYRFKLEFFIIQSWMKMGNIDTWIFSTKHNFFSVSV